MKSLKTAVLCLLIACCGGCIRNKVYFTSNPPGAKVTLNEQYRGRTPIEIPWIWDWKYTVEIEREGYESQSGVVHLKSPIWQIIPLDFIAEAIPLRFENRRNLHYELRPAPESPVADVTASQPAIPNP